MKREFNIGDQGFYEICKGSVVRRLPARIINKYAHRLHVRVLRGNGHEETKTISPKNFVKVPA